MADQDDISGRVRLRELKTLSDNWYTLRKASFEWQRGDGQWQHQERESYDIGDAATVLPYDRVRDKIILIKQFRWADVRMGLSPAYGGSHCRQAGTATPPLTASSQESMEEAGVAITNPRLLTYSFVSPGAVKERVSLYLADYDSAAPRAQGGGEESEGEDIIVMEMSLDAGLAMIASGEIVDLKTIALLQAAKLEKS